MSLKSTLINGIRHFFITNMPRVRRFGEFHNTSKILPPTTISGRENVYISNDCFIDSDSVLYATNARIVIKKYTGASKHLTIITGAHERRLGRFYLTISESEKDASLGLDKDVIINEDVWIGINVTIMPGVQIGRGATVAASSVVTKSIPPYSICAGVPARFIKFYWTIDQILEHEKQLYSVDERFSREELEHIYQQYKK